ncbi:MAG: PAS domain-containing sensor histidine kinase [Candidatus Colwellbacteria bacterium]|nr:PAS domain-containing sensor histidine kinase [Candidatus Colwellbacteria bacterium]
MKSLRRSKSRRKKEDKKEAAKTLFYCDRGFFDGLFEGVAVYRYIPDKKDFIILDINKSVEKIEKVRKKEVIGRFLTDVFPGVKEMNIFAAFKRVWKTGKAEKYPAVAYKDERISGWRENYIFRLSTGEVVAVYRDLTAEKRAEDEVVKSEKRYRKMFNLMPDIMFMVDSKLRIQMMNDAGMRMIRSLGLPEDPIGKDIFEMIPLLPKSTKKEYAEVFRTGVPFSGEVNYHIGGVILIGQTNRIPLLKDGKVLSVLGIIHDVTADRRNEWDLQKSIERFNYIASLAGEMLWESDMEGVITYVSSAMEKIMGYKPDELIGKKRYADLLSSDEKDKAERLIRDYYSKRKEFNRVPVKALNKKGEEVSLELSGTPVFGEEGLAEGYMGIASDVTERRAYMANLYRFQLSVENASDHIIITDPDGKIIFANKAASDITGYSIKEMIGETPALWGKQMPLEFYKDMWRKIKYDKERFVGEITNKRKNGDLYIAEAKISPVLDEKGDIRFFVGIERDITKAKEVDRAKTEFVSLASHQLRTPLSIINWYAEMLLSGDKGELNEGQEKYLDEIHKSCHRMIDLVNALLNVSRIDMGTLSIVPKLVSIPDIIDVILEESLPQIKKKKISISKDYDTIPEVMADPDLSRIIFQNLISNAVKYVSDNGKVSIRARIEKEKIIVDITDDGCGIPEGQQSKIFTKLFRADNAKVVDPDGNGLGLYVVKSIMDASGGEVRFKSSEGKGSTFSISIPVSGMKPKGKQKTLLDGK